MKSYIENEEKIKSPIKYYRTILNITQKDLAGEKYTRGYIQSLESGKRVPPYKCALYLAERIKEIAKVKRITIDVTMDEFMKNENERIYDFLLKRIEYIIGDEKNENNIRNYKDLVIVINKYNFSNLERKVNTLIADELLKCKNYTEAIEYYNKVLVEIKYNQYTLNEISVLRKIGICFYKNQNYDKSIENYSKAEELYSYNQLDDSEEYIKILLNISLSLKKNKDIEKSIEYIKRALCIKGLNQKMLYKLKLQLGNNYQNIYEYGKALKIYKELYSEYPADYLLNYNLALAYENLGKKDKTEKFLETCLSCKIQKNEQQSIYALMLLGKIKLEKKEIINAEKCFDYAIEIASKSKDSGMIIYSIRNIYELLSCNGMMGKFVKYLKVVIFNENIILKNKNNISQVLIILLKCSTELEFSKEDKNKVRDIINIIEGRI